MGLAISLIEMNHRFSVYYLEWRVVIHLLLALIIQCIGMFFFFCSKVLHRYNITLLGDHMSRLIVQYVNRYSKAS